MDVLDSVFHEEDWPKEAEAMYKRIEVLGRGSYGLVWMGRRVTRPENDEDEEYVALKNIEIKEEKSKVYAQREISILSEIRHPNVIRLIRAFPIYKDMARLVVLQLARGPNLQRVVSKRGALGIPLARLISRQLVAAVSYLHGRAVLHRDIKPTNCILENTELPPQVYYDYTQDSTIWSDGVEAQECVERNKWKMMLVDFGFARALDEKEILQQSRPMRNSIMLERKPMECVEPITESDDDHSDWDDMDEMIEKTAAALRRESIREEDLFVGIDEDDGSTKQRRSYVSTLAGVDEPPSKVDTDGEPSVSENGGVMKRPSRVRTSFSQIRNSTTRAKVRSLSALGTKAYAAPEIRHELRNKTMADHEKVNAALTECVADYGMIVDAYSVGWTLRVILSGVPPNSTISHYLEKFAGQEIEEDEIVEVGCCCFGGTATIDTFVGKATFRVRDIPDMPKVATLFISALTKPSPEERMSIREAQNHPWIRGDETEPHYEVVQGDYPSRHGDPVAPLKCAGELSSIVVAHHR